MNFLSQGFKDG